MLFSNYQVCLVIWQFFASASGFSRSLFLGGILGENGNISLDLDVFVSISIFVSIFISFWWGSIYSNKSLGSRSFLTDMLFLWVLGL